MNCASTNIWKQKKFKMLALDTINIILVDEKVEKFQS